MTKLFKSLATLALVAVMSATMVLPAFASTLAAQASITTDRAQEIALDVYPNATVIRTKYEFKRKTGVSYYEVYLEQDGVRVEVKLDADTGVLRPGYDTNLFDVATISADTARTTALNLYPGATVIKAELEYEKGVLVYEFELRQANGRKAEVYINANTGIVVKNKAK